MNSNFEPVSVVPMYNGFQKVFQFPNGFGASVISHDHSYGGSQGLYEIAVLNKKGDIVYDTPITDDVIGYLTEEDVNSYLDKISKLNQNG